VVKFVPPEIIEEIRTRADIVEIVSEYVRMKKQGKNYVGLCPFHLEDTPSFSVSPEKQIFYCFGCQKGGNVIHFIMEQENLTLPEAACLLADRVGVTIPSGKMSELDFARQSVNQKLMDMHEIAGDFFHQQLFGANGKVARKYLEKREITRDTVLQFKLGYAPDTWDSLKNYLQSKGFSETEMETAGLVVKSSKGTFYDKFRHRLMFPIWDYRGKIVAFGGRVMGEELPKYLNSPETPVFHKSQNLYGINLAAGFVRQHDEAIIMEGYMDVISAWQFGIKNAVASLGTSFTSEQGKLLKRYSANVLLAYDADTAGAKATYRGLEILQNLGFRVRVLFLPNGLDPDEFLHKYNLSAWTQLVQNKTMGLLEYKLQQAITKYGLKSIEAKADIVKSLLPEISKVKSQVEREQFIKLVAGKLDISPDSVYADLGRKGNDLLKGDNFSKHKHTNSANRNSNQKNILTEAYRIAERNLFKLMAEDQNIFHEVESTLGIGFCEDPRLNQVLQLIKNHYSGFNWNPADLIQRLEDSGLKQFISALFIEDFPGENKEKVAHDCIRTIKLHKLKKRIETIQKVIGGGEKQTVSGEIIQLLQEYTRLQQQLQQLKR